METRIDEHATSGRRVLGGSASARKKIVACRSSIRNLYDTLSSLNLEKRRIVSSIGFGGLLKFPPIKQMNKKFTVWLLPRFNGISSSLSAGDGKTLAVSKHDVNRMFGIPDSGRSISDLGMPDKETVRRISTKYLGMGINDTRSIRFAQDVVQKQHKSAMTQDEVDSFKAAFVVFVMSTLLTPGAKFDYVSVDYWNAINEPSSIASYDWSDYVLQKLIDGAVKFQADMVAGAKSPSVTGCTLFLQLFYLDNIDLVSLKMDHTVFPRISSFTPEKIKYMIRADTLATEGCGQALSYGKSKVRKPRECCYTWSASTAFGNARMAESRSTDLWNTTISLARTLQVPVEAAGPLFHCITEMEDMLANNIPVSLLKIMSAIVRITSPFTNGFSYRTGSECRAMENTTGGASASSSQGTASSGANNCFANHTQERAAEVACKRWPDIPNGSIYKHKCNCTNISMMAAPAANEEWASTGLTSIDFSVEARVSVTAMAKYYLCDRAEKFSRAATGQPNEPANGFHLGKGRAPRMGVLPMKRMSPWHITMEMENAAIKTTEIWKWLKTNYSTTLSSRDPLISHHIPKYIEVLTVSARDQILGISEMEMDLFDAILRRIKECEDTMFAGVRAQRYKHYIESDFMESLIAGWFNPNDTSLKAEFIGQHINYDIRKCILLLFPAIVEHRWVCYAWHMDVNKICIYDPAMPSEGQESCHFSITSKLKQGMRTIASTHFIQWDHDFMAAGVEMIQLANKIKTAANRSGVLCADFCQNYRGLPLETPASEVDIDMKASILLIEVCQLSGNKGRIPRELL